MKLRIELIDDHDGSVSYRTLTLNKEWNELIFFEGRLDDIVNDMLDSYEKSKQNI